jgi:heavy metal sensor kinase
MFTKSIRWRLQMWHGLILVAVLTGFGLTAYHVACNNQLQRIDRELDQQLMSVFRPQPPAWPPGNAPTQSQAGPPEPRPEESHGNRHFGPPDSGPRIRKWIEQAGALDASQTNGFYYVLWQEDGSVLARSAGAPADVPGPAQGGPAAARAADQGATGGKSPPERPLPPMPSVARTRGEFRELLHYLPRGECLLVGRSMASDFAAMRRLALWLLAAGATVLLLGLAGGWWLATRAIRPIEDISATATKIAAGDLSQRINAADSESELGHLVAVLNATFARLEAAFAQQKQFTADASHELRTPLAVIISEAQTTLARERSSAQYRETIEGCLSTAQQMRRLTESLLELACFDTGDVPMKRERFDLSQVVREAVDLLRPLLEQRHLTTACNLTAVECVGDAQRIQQVATNLLTNAIRFNRDHGEIRVSVGTDDRNVILEVADTGEGISPEDLPHIFERFYRADKSRSRARGGKGLGLAICKAIVDAHSGSIVVSSQPGAGSVFTVRLPRQHV